MPTPLRTPQTSGHSSFRVSNLPLWSLKPPPSHGSKIIIFHLSQSKCTVSALFLHTGGKAVVFRPAISAPFAVFCKSEYPIASLETVQKQCRNRALTLGQIKNDDF